MLRDFNLGSFERSFAAILAGFATMIVLVTAATMGARRLFARSMQGENNYPVRYLLLNLAYSSLFAAVGGYVTSAVAKSDPLRNILMLGIVILLLTALSALQLRGQQPVTYQLALIVLTPAAALAGGLLRMHQAGYRFS